MKKEGDFTPFIFIFNCLDLPLPQILQHGAIKEIYWPLLVNFFRLYGSTDLGYLRSLGVADADPAFPDYFFCEGAGYYVST